MSLSHSFNIEIAQEIGVSNAIVLQHFGFWYKKVVIDGVNRFEGKFWVRMKLSQLHKIFPYYSTDQLRRYVEKLISENLLIDGSFNEKKGDRTKWYTLTDEAKNMLGIDDKKLTGEFANGSTGENANGTGEFANSNNKEVVIRSKYKLQHKKLSENYQLLEIVAMHNKLKLETVKKAVSDFILNAQALGKEWNNDLDLQSHFQYWVPKQNYSDVNLETEINWFIDQFNSSFKTEFVVTDTMRKRFARQLQFGFTGRQMLKAAANMRSSNPKNKFHIENQFKFATPEYLLKDDNVNKYLNVKL